ncbi:type II toxin-antitoxin system PemK/MazF family toxin [Alkaliphilus transvaalensis]|uniref:type II toxin-antitoxin system PemK/MazF family toxin n=1 Tax=Alkaliphilus transvaalensis TaxID=114628 RepID=UPI00047B0563|nr:type II toxin-antitoxin system PemK/MazF family toxin [Alkaliphilus transvaalensis]
MCKRGDVYFVDFGDNKKSKKQLGVRPVVIVSNNKANIHSPVITIVPLTSRIKKKFLPTHVYIPASSGSGLKSPSVALAEQVDSIDKNRLLEKRGNIASKAIMKKITKAIQIQIGAFDKFN